MKSPTSIYHGILELLYFILIFFYFYLFFLIWFYLFFWVNEEACDHGHMICHMIQHHRSKHCSRTMMSESMTTTCSSYSNSMVDSWATCIVKGRTCNSGIYSVGIHWELLVEFSCNFHKILYL